MNGKYLKFANIIGLASLMAMDGQPTPAKTGRSYHPKPNPKQPIPKGCKEYTIDGITVVAISEKSARKKIERRLKNVK